jgi:hypothetical protein
MPARIASKRQRGKQSGKKDSTMSLAEKSPQLLKKWVMFIYVRFAYINELFLIFLSLTRMRVNKICLCYLSIEKSSDSLPETIKNRELCHI